MSNTAVIRINCDRNTISLEADYLEDYHLIGKHAMETSNAYLIATILAPQMRDLMKLSKSELKAMHLATLKAEQ